MSKILYLDLETTGTDEHIHQIYQLSALVEIDGNIVEEYDTYIAIDPSLPVDDWVFNQWSEDNFDVNHLMTCKSVKDIHSEFTRMLGKYVNIYSKTDKFHLCGYNVGFDERFLRKMFLRCGDSYFNSYFWSDKLDVMGLASFVLIGIRHKLSNFKLETLCRLFGISITAHNSMSDITATRNLYLGLKNYLEIKGIPND